MGHQQFAIMIVQSAFPAYRRGFLEALHELVGDEVVVVAGDSQFTETVRTDLGSESNLIRVHNRYLLGRRMLWQSGVLRHAMGAKAVILEFNPRIINTFVVLVVRRLLGRPSLLWGHVWSRSGPESRSNLLRRLIARLGDGVIAYTNADRDAFRDQMGVRRVWTAPNAVMHRSEMTPAHVERPSDIVVSARLTPEKKPLLALAAFTRIADELPDARLVFVGDGPLRESLEIAAAHSGLTVRVRFLGETFDDASIASVYERARVSLSPGYVGLSITQSHGYGVPMIYCRDEPHAPEVTIAEEGVNAISVPSDEPAAMAEAILRIFRDGDVWTARRPAIVERCREAYSFEAMAEGCAVAIRATATRRD